MSMRRQPEVGDDRRGRPPAAARPRRPASGSRAPRRPTGRSATRSPRSRPRAARGCLARDPDQHEEVLVDRDQPERAEVTGPAAQLGGERVDVVRPSSRDLLDLPDVLLAVGHESEVHALARSASDVLRRSCPSIACGHCDHGTTAVAEVPASHQPGCGRYGGAHARTRGRPPARLPQAHDPAGRAHRLADVPPARRRAGHAAGLRGDPRRARRAGDGPDPGRRRPRACASPSPSRSSYRSCGPASACSTA